MKYTNNSNNDNKTRHPLTNTEHWQIHFVYILSFDANNFEITITKIPRR